MLAAGKTQVVQNGDAKFPVVLGSIPYKIMHKGFSGISSLCF
jgi:hypothetical protein